MYISMERILVMLILSKHISSIPAQHLDPSGGHFPPQALTHKLYALSIPVQSHRATYGRLVNLKTISIEKQKHLERMKSVHKVTSLRSDADSINATQEEASV